MKKAGLMTGSMIVLAGTACAQDGMNIGAGQTLLGVQNSPTSFGDSAGGQASQGGGEINSLWGSLSGGTLDLSLAANIEGLNGGGGDSFNKMVIFLDTKAGGENVAQNDNFIGGFNEINNLAGLTWDAAFSPDYAIQFELGGGSWSARFADLQANTGGDIATGSGVGDLPALNIAGAFGIDFGWDNGNALGVTSTDASGALTATTGFEFSIDTALAFGDGALSEVKMAAIYGSADLMFLSNQVLGETGIGVDGSFQLAGPGGVDFNQFEGNQFAVIPAPGAAALLGLGAMATRRRR